MILNTGSRTDIPAYYSEWFYNRIKEGFVLVRNPYYPEQVLKYNLSPETVDMLTFCTKNPEPMLERMDELNQYRQFWFVTITPYGKDIEPNVPDKERVMEAFQKLSEKVGIKAVSWRYDPIFISDQYSLEFHLKSFEKMAENLKGCTDNCVISFIDLYAKTKRNFPKVREVRQQERLAIGKEFVQIGKKYGIQLRSCCEGKELEPFGVDSSGCMTRELLEKAGDCSFQIPKRKKSPRSDCNCLLGSDIGMYNTCGHGCIYCYANYDRKTVLDNMKMHNPQSPFLIGGYKEDDRIKEAKQENYVDGQLTFDFVMQNKHT